jgi:hypothetical protein
LARAKLGAYRLAQGPVFIDLAVGLSAVLARNMAACFCAIDFPNKGVFSITSARANFYSVTSPSFTSVFL